MIDEFEIGEDAVVDVEDDPDRRLQVGCAGSRPGWQDMASFPTGVADSRLAGRRQRGLPRQHPEICARLEP